VPIKTIAEAVMAAGAGDVIKIRGEFSNETTINLDKELWLIGENATTNAKFIISALHCRILNILFKEAIYA